MHHCGVWTNCLFVSINNVQFLIPSITFLGDFDIKIIQSAWIIVGARHGSGARNTTCFFKTGSWQRSTINGGALYKSIACIEMILLSCSRAQVELTSLCYWWVEKADQKSKLGFQTEFWYGAPLEGNVAKEVSLKTMMKDAKNTLTKIKTGSSALQRDPVSDEYKGKHCHGREVRTQSQLQIISRTRH